MKNKTGAHSMQILQDDSPILHTKAKPPERGELIRPLARDLLQAMKAANGIGIAAPQIGVAKRICVISREAGFTEDVVLVNPTYTPILESTDPTIPDKINREQIYSVSVEGCLSIRNASGDFIWYKVPRFRDIILFTRIARIEDLRGTTKIEDLQIVTAIIKSSRFPVVPSITSNDPSFFPNDHHKWDTPQYQRLLAVIQHEVDHLYGVLISKKGERVT